MNDASVERRLHVLIVDDCCDTTDSVARLMDLWGHSVRVAHDGGEAIAIATQQRPDVVLLDIGLPGMTGWDVARRLRVAPGLERAFMVAVSGYGQADDVARSRAAGCDLHLVKPVAPETLQDLLRNRQVEAACLPIN